MPKAKPRSTAKIITLSHIPSICYYSPILLCKLKPSVRLCKGYHSWAADDIGAADRPAARPGMRNNDVLNSGLRNSRNEILEREGRRGIRGMLSFLETFGTCPPNSLLLDIFLMP